MLDYTMSRLLGRLARIDSEEGASAVEYGLLLALIAGVIVIAVAALGGDAMNWMTSVNNTQW